MCVCDELKWIAVNCSRSDSGYLNEKKAELRVNALKVANSINIGDLFICESRDAEEDGVNIYWLLRAVCGKQRRFRKVSRDQDGKLVVTDVTTPGVKLFVATGKCVYNRKLPCTKDDIILACEHLLRDDSDEELLTFMVDDTSRFDFEKNGLDCRREINASEIRYRVLKEGFDYTVLDATEGIHGGRSLRRIRLKREVEAKVLATCY